MQNCVNSSDHCLPVVSVGKLIVARTEGGGDLNLIHNFLGKPLIKCNVDLYLLSSQGVFMEGLGVVGDTRQWGGKQSALNNVLQ